MSNIPGSGERRSIRALKAVEALVEEVGQLRDALLEEQGARILDKNALRKAQGELESARKDLECLIAAAFGQQCDLIPTTERASAAVQEIRRLGIENHRRLVEKATEALSRRRDPPADPHDPLEVAYWRFDARRKGDGQWKGAPQSERDAFKAEMRTLLSAQRAVRGPKPFDGTETAP